MSTLVIEHEVADFQTRKSAFDSDPMDRVPSGVTAHDPAARRRSDGTWRSVITPTKIDHTTRRGDR